jgi:hypothetical protein
MKTFVIALAMCTALCTPAYADTVEVPVTQAVPVKTQPVSFKALDEELRQYQLNKTVSVKLNEHLSFGRIPLIPFQTYAGSATKLRRLVGLSLRVAF